MRPNATDPDEPAALFLVDDSTEPATRGRRKLGRHERALMVSVNAKGLATDELAATVSAARALMAQLDAAEAKGAGAAFATPQLAKVLRDYLGDLGLIVTAGGGGERDPLDFGSDSSAPLGDPSKS